MNATDRAIRIYPPNPCRTGGRLITLPPPYPWGGFLARRAPQTSIKLARGADSNIGTRQQQLLRHYTYVCIITAVVLPSSSYVLHAYLYKHMPVQCIAFPSPVLMTDSETHYLTSGDSYSRIGHGSYFVVLLLLPYIVLVYVWRVYSGVTAMGWTHFSLELIDASQGWKLISSEWTSPWAASFGHGSYIILDNTGSSCTHHECGKLSPLLHIRNKSTVQCFHWVISLIEYTIINTFYEFIWYLIINSGLWIEIG